MIIELTPFYFKKDNLIQENMSLYFPDISKIEQTRKRKIDAIEADWISFINSLKTIFPNYKIIDQTSILKNSYSLAVIIESAQFDCGSSMLVLKIHISWLLPYCNAYIQVESLYKPFVSPYPYYSFSEKVHNLASFPKEITGIVDVVKEKFKTALFFPTMQPKYLISQPSGEIEMKELSEIIF
ncbi:MAG: hypothetical protein JNJ57_16495 [Saprospiraceae bacterium]|nr:hypothetical protein [Saprospiraceae bacterium]